MNVINKFLLNLVLFPSGIYRNMGVNSQHLRAILTAKLIMDDRRPNTFQQTQFKKRDKPISGATLGTMLISTLMGIFFLTSFDFGHNFVTHFSFYFSFYIFLLASTLISDFTSVLIDVRDNYIILPKPVNDRTVVMARLLHITVHISKLVIPMIIPCIVYLVFMTNVWCAFIFLILTLLATLFTIFLINSLYIIILKVTTPKKFQGIINFFQIFFAVIIFGSYQLLPRMMTRYGINEFDISGFRWAWLLPSYWFAGAWQCLSQFDFDSRWVAAAAISLTVPFVSLWVVVKYFAPSFNRKLSQITGGDTETTILPAGKTVRNKVRPVSLYLSLLAKWFTKQGPERMAFMFCWKMTLRSKDFKLKVYPAFGYMLVYFVAMFLNTKRVSIYDVANETRLGKLVIISVIYFSSFMLLMAINQVVYSEKFKAAWIYFIAPVSSPGKLMSGALKSVMVQFYVPVILVIAAAVITITGYKVVPNLVFGMLNELFICSFVAFVSMEYLPFSAMQQNKAKGLGFIKNLFVMIFPLIIGFIHYLVYSMLWVIGILSVLSIIATWLIMGSIANKSWKKVRSTYDDAT